MLLWTWRQFSVWIWISLCSFTSFGIPHGRSMRFQFKTFEDVLEFRIWIWNFPELLWKLFLTLIDSHLLSFTLKLFYDLVNSETQTKLSNKVAQLSFLALWMFFLTIWMVHLKQMILFRFCFDFTKFWNLFQIDSKKNFSTPSRRFGPKCSGCSFGISPTDLVRKTKDSVYHLSCFVCLVCHKKLTTGDHCYNLEGKFVCKDDYISSRHLHILNLHPGKMPFFFFSLAISLVICWQIAALILSDQLEFDWMRWFIGALNKAPWRTFHHGRI